MSDRTNLMAGKTVLVTGGTGGIGRATAEGLARLGARVAVTVLHPGVTRTAFGAEDPTGMMRAMTLVARPFMKAPQQGAATPIYLASSPEVEGITGRYFANRRPKKSSKSSYNTATAAQLWQVSTCLAGLTTTV